MTEEIGGLAGAFHLVGAVGDPPEIETGKDQKRVNQMNKASRKKENKGGKPLSDRKRLINCSICDRSSRDVFHATSGENKSRLDKMKPENCFLNIVEILNEYC